MKNEIDEFMAANELDALLITGSAVNNPAMVYFTGVKSVRKAYLIKQRGQSPILFHNAMERDEAASTGLQTKNLNDYEPYRLLEETGGDSIRASFFQQSIRLVIVQILGRNWRG